MGSIRVRKSKLFFDFRFLGERCRELTLHSDTKSNRKKLLTILERIEADITLGSFIYVKYFPNSPMVQKFAELQKSQSSPYSETPLFKDFAKEWYAELEPTWRISTAEMYQRFLDNRLIPHFGEMEVSQITKAHILKYRSDVAKQSKGTLKAKTINKYIKCLNMIMNEAADRFDFKPPHLNIKPLKEDKVHIEPFSINDVNRILSNVREYWRDYLFVRFFTGVRTGEIDGLKWEYIDFERREILVRETFSMGRWEYTKNDGSQREIEMPTIVYQTLLERYAKRNTKFEMVFHANNGSPVHNPNFLRRVWKPLLAYLNLKYRKPYQTRHTAATLWLSAGENPNWIARQMGHTSTNMLFSVYSRYVPNLTHQDGSAMDRLLASNIENYHQVAESKPEASVQPEKNKVVDKAQLEQKETEFWDQFLIPKPAINFGGVR